MFSLRALFRLFFLEYIAHLHCSVVVLIRELSDLFRVIVIPPLSPPFNVWLDIEDFKSFPRVQQIFDLSGSYELRDAFHDPNLVFFCSQPLSSIDMSNSSAPINEKLHGLFRLLYPTGTWLLVHCRKPLPERITPTSFRSFINISHGWEVRFRDREREQSDAVGNLPVPTPNPSNRAELPNSMPAYNEREPAFPSSFSQPLPSHNPEPATSSLSQQLNIRLAQLAKQHTANVT